MEFTLYTADCCGRAENTVYPEKAVIRSADDLREAVSKDHVCARFRDSRRSIGRFLTGDAVVMDCDNDHSDNPRDWIQPEQYRELFPDVSLAVVPSRHDGQQKGGRTARPRHHVYFPSGPLMTAEACAALKRRIYRAAPFFDREALDAARFIFGSRPGSILWVEGRRTIADFLDEQDAAAGDQQAGTVPEGSGTTGRLSDRQTGMVPEGTRNSTMSRLAGRLIKRYGDTAEARRIFSEKAQDCSPPLPERELDSIWASAVKFGRQVEAQEGYVPPEAYNTPVWDEPIPLDTLHLPVFPVQTLPPAIAGQVTALAESTQTPVDMAATCALAVLSVCMQGRYKIRAKPDWTEPVNLFILNVMNPSERKSAVESAMVAPLTVWESEQNSRNGAQIESDRMHRRILERRQKAVEEQAAKGTASETEIAAIAEEIASFRELKPVKLYVDDITTEKLTSVLADNDGRAAILSTEGGLFDTLAGAYAKTVNIDVMLKGYSGDSIRVDRIGRSSETIMNPALTVLLMVQPGVLAGLMQNDTFRSRGLTARFLYCIPASSVGTRRYRSASVPDAVSRAWEACVRNLLEDGPGEEPEIITLSEEADRMLEAFAEALEPELIRRYADIADWAGKLVGNTLRISALLCRAGTYRDHNVPGPAAPLVVSGRTMADAIRIAKYFLAHAEAAFSLLALDPVVKKSRKVIETIREKHLQEFSRRDIMRACRWLHSAEEVQQILDRLQEYGYIEQKAGEKYSGKGRPALQTYLANPFIFR